MYLCKLLCLKYDNHTQSFFCPKLHHSSTIIILSWKSQSTRYEHLSYLLSIRLDLPECSIYIPSYSIRLSLSSLSNYLGPYPTTTQILTIEILHLIHRILELTHPKYTTTLCHTSEHHDTSPFPFNFVSVNASNSKFPPLKTFTNSSLFAIPFI